MRPPGLHERRPASTDARPTAPDLLPEVWSETVTPEELKPSDLKTEVECDHLIGYRHSQRDAFLIDLDDDLEPNTLFAYCPKCGEKL